MWALNWMKGLIIPIVPKDLISQPSQHSRLSSYLDYRLNDTIINYIEIDNTRLHYQAFNKDQTVQTLQDQYVKFHGKEMILEDEDVKISPSMPLSDILVSSENRQIFQNIVQKLQRKEKVEVTVVPPEKKESFTKIVKQCNEYSSFQCTVEMKNGLRKPLTSKMTVTATTTFKKIIDELNKHPLVEGKDIQFLNEEEKLIDPEHYGKSFESLGFKEKILKAQYSYKNSLMRRDTVISVKSFQGGSAYIDSLKEMPRNEDIYSYNSKEMRMDRNKLGNYRQELVTHFFRVSLTLKMKEIEEDNLSVTLEATGSLRLLVLTKEFEEIWMSIEKLSKSDVIGGVHPRRNEFALYQIEYIQQVKLEQAEPFYSLQALPAHHFIANRLIIHNCDSFTIRAKYLGENPREQEVRFYRSDPISKHFGELVCQVGGFTLNSRMTFGDYQLDQFQIIYVYEGEAIEKTNTRQHTISEWRKASINRDQAQPAHLQEFHKKIQEQYFGIYNRRIIPTSQIDGICKEKQIGVINVLIALRMHFERVYYYLNKEPSYVGKDQERFNHYLPEFQQNDTYKKGLNYGKKLGLKDVDILGINVYTAEKIYRDLNKYLRLDYLKNNQEMDDQYLPDAGWICRSTKKAKAYRGVTYRGISRIDLKIALNLDRHCPQIQGKDPEYRDKFIIFNNFTSTSKDEKVARHFLVKESPTNCLLKIIVNRGFEVQQFSQFPEEKQVLILPFTYFIINNYSLNGPLQTAELEQIPMPQKNSSQLIFWVDDEPEYNDEIKEHFQNKGIEVVQVTSTRIMRVILQNFFWIFKMLGRKVVIISDMVRKEYGVINYMAGVDLFQHIFTDYGLSNKAIIFATDKIKAEENLREKGVVEGNWVVLTQTKQLISVVLEQFNKM